MASIVKECSPILWYDKHMGKSKEERMVENEVIFRQANQKVQDGLARLEKMAIEHGQSEMVEKYDVPLHFYCECANENCRERIIMTSDKYKELHQNKSQFIVLPGHEEPIVE